MVGFCFHHCNHLCTYSPDTVQVWRCGNFAEMDDVTQNRTKKTKIENLMVYLVPGTRNHDSHGTMPIVKIFSFHDSPVPVHVHTVVKLFKFSGLVTKAKTCFASFPEFLDEAGQ